MEKFNERLYRALNKLIKSNSSFFFIRCTRALLSIKYHFLIGLLVFINFNFLAAFDEIIAAINPNIIEEVNCKAILGRVRAGHGPSVLQ